MQENDLLFFSPLQVFQSKQDDAFVPLPDSLRRKVEADFAPKILDCFRSTATGELFAIPVIANPEVIYLNTALLRSIILNCRRMTGPGMIFWRFHVS